MNGTGDARIEWMPDRTIVLGPLNANLDYGELDQFDGAVQSERFHCWCTRSLWGTTYDTQSGVGHVLHTALSMYFITHIRASLLGHQCLNPLLFHVCKVQNRAQAKYSCSRTTCKYARAHTQMHKYALTDFLTLLLQLTGCHLTFLAGLWFL